MPVISEGQLVQFSCGGVFLETGIVQEIKYVANNIVSYKINNQWYSNPDFTSFTSFFRWEQRQEISLNKSLTLTGKTHLRSLVMRCQELLEQIQNHEEFICLDPYSDFTIGDASRALIELMEALCQ
ncbi:hypothetical protein H6G36_25485 [Anabaena minutissima FACHB-250]|nr:hypothetical protein [Anabaena minutissima FACHB-250]